MRLKVDPALRRPSGILKKQKMPKVVVNMVLASSSLRIHTWWFQKSNPEGSAYRNRLPDQ
jgi:hypothetical protein